MQTGKNKDFVQDVEREKQLMALYVLTAMQKEEGRNMELKGLKDQHMESVTYVEEMYWKGKEYVKVAIIDYLSIQEKWMNK